MTRSVDPLLFSVIIPTYNRPERLAKCLDSLARQTLPVDRWEVVVVDDGSPHSMESVVTPVRSHLQIRLIRQANAGPAAARNAGAAAATAQYLAFTDDDCQPLANWLEQLAGEFAQNPSALIGGQTLNALPGNLYSTASQLLIDYLYSYYNDTQEEPTFFASNNFAVPRDAYQKLGGFDTSFPLAAGEDREFCDRWLQHGLPMHYAPAVQIYHAHSLKLASYWRQHFNYGRGALHFHEARSRRQAEAIKVEPLAFYIRLLLYPLSRQQSWNGLSLAGLFFISQVANVAGFFWEKRQQKLLPAKPSATSP